jgi:Domain of unknown function (DUF397)
MGLMAQPSHLVWRKSSYSNGSGGNCVEVAAGRGRALVAFVRDSKDRGGPVLAFTAEAWEVFVAAVRGESFGSMWS